MIRTRSLLFIILFALVSPNANAAFDKEVLEKTTEFLKQKERSRKLRTHLYPGVHPEKKAINEQHYLQKKQEKLLQKYEDSRATAKNHGIKQTVLGVVGALGLIFCVDSSQALGALISAVITGASGYAAYENFSYAC